MQEKKVQDKVEEKLVVDSSSEDESEKSEQPVQQIEVRIDSGSDPDMSDDESGEVSDESGEVESHESGEQA